jgi:5'-nucleotidase
MFRRIGLLLSLLVLIVVLIPITVAQEEETFSLTIMHTNDEHAAHEPDANGDGGAARQATVVDQIRAEVENSLLLDGGDRFTGTLFHVQYRGQDSAMLMNALGYDAMTLGNHEFDDGSDVLAAFINALDFPVVTANVDFSESEQLAGLVEPWVIMEVGGESIGIIGLVTPETEILSKPAAELIFDYDLAGVAQEMVDELTAMGVNKIILLTHIGYNADLEVGQAVSGVDVIVGGHTNTFLSNIYQGAVGEYPTVLTSASGEPLLVVQASTKTKYLGRLDVEFDASGVLTGWEGDAILLSRYIAADPEIADMIAGLAEPIEELRATAVGETGVFLVGDRAVCRYAECNLGNLITDAMIAETGAQIAIQNGGGIRANIPNEDTPEDLAFDTPATVTLGDVLTVLPFGNLVSTLELRGEDVWAALEHGVSRAENPENEGTGRFPQVSGLRYTWDGSQEVGSRLISVEVLNAEGDYEPLDLDAVYTVVTNDFTRTGGDGYEMLRDNAIEPYDFGRPLDQVVADYIAANSPVAPEIEGRITRIDAQ